MIESLNQQFGIADQVVFELGQGNLPKIAITNRYASAEIYLLGAHVTAFQPQGAQPVLWLSPQTPFALGQAIRGGIPVIWPWFGAHPSDPTMPAHGFVRTRPWTVSHTQMLPNGETRVELSLIDDQASQALWPHPFALRLRVTIGTSLQVDLISCNTGSSILTDLSAALHTYFNVGDIEQISITGLDGRAYLDKVEDFAQVSQQGDITFAQEVDRIYLDTPDECQIIDPVLGRQIHVDKRGSQSTVVWNPWQEKAKQMPDMPNEGYQTMVCVETANAANDVYSLVPGEEHTLSQIVVL